MIALYHPKGAERYHEVHVSEPSIWKKRMISELALILHHKTLFANAILIALLSIADIGADTPMEHWTLTGCLGVAVVYLVRQITLLLNAAEKEREAASNERKSRELVMDQLVQQNTESQRRNAEAVDKLNAQLTGPIQELIKKGLGDK